MYKKKLTTNEAFALAVKNHKKNNLETSRKLCAEILKGNPNHIMNQIKEFFDTDYTLFEKV